MHHSWIKLIVQKIGWFFFFFSKRILCICQWILSALLLGQLVQSVEWHTVYMCQQGLCACVDLVVSDHFYLSRPFWAAAPPGIILVMKMEGSSPMWGLSVPPAMLNPRPELPCAHKGTRGDKHRKQLKPILTSDQTDTIIEWRKIGSCS